MVISSKRVSDLILKRIFWMIFKRERLRKQKTKLLNYREVTFKTGVDVLGQPTYRTHLVGITDNIHGKKQAYIRGFNHR